MAVYQMRKVCAAFVAPNPSAVLLLLFAGTPANVDKLVPSNHLAFGNPGGNFWTDVKSGTMLPRFDILRKATLWAEPGLYSRSVWSWLCEGAQDFAVAAVEDLFTQAGQAHGISIDIGEKKGVLRHGQLGPLVKSRQVVNLLYIEADASMTELSSTPSPVYGKAGSPPA